MLLQQHLYYSIQALMKDEARAMTTMTTRYAGVKRSERTVCWVYNRKWFKGLQVKEERDVSMRDVRENAREDAREDGDETLMAEVREVSSHFLTIFVNRIYSLMILTKVVHHCNRAYTSL